MGFIAETPENIKLEYPKLYESILKKMSAKNVDINSLEWGYSVCFLFDNPDNPKTLAESIDESKLKCGISIVATSGRKKVEELVKKAGVYGEIPSIFITNVQNNWNENLKKKTSKDNLVINLDSVLKAVGKSGTAKNTTSGNVFNFKTPVYPELSDIKKVRPDIYQNYIDKADGTVIIMYAPHRENCDEWGFTSEPVLLATRRNDETRFVTTDYGSHYFCTDELENEGLLPWGGGLSSIDKAFAAIEGQNFIGWKRTKQYRLTKNEIETFIKYKILNFGGIGLM